MRLRHGSLRSCAAALSVLLLASDAEANNQAITLLAETCNFINTQSAGGIRRLASGGVTGSTPFSWRIRCPLDFFSTTPHIEHQATIKELQAWGETTCKFPTQIEARVRRRLPTADEYTDISPPCTIVGVETSCSVAFEHAVDDWKYAYVLDFTVPYPDGDCWTWFRTKVEYLVFPDLHP